MFNKEGPIKDTVKVNIYYQGYKEKTKINVIGEQKWNMILAMSWLAHHNPEIDWRIGEVKMMRYPKDCSKQWRPKQEKSEWKK